MIRAERPADASVVRGVLTRAFSTAGPDVADLADDLRAHAAACLVAERYGVVIGAVMLSTGWVDAPDRLLDVLVLSPVGVDPPFQRTGVGGDLVRAALREARRLHSPLLFLEGHPGYYGRFGFERGSGHGFSAPSARTPDAAFQVAVLPDHEPWMTGAVVYPDVFWRHDSVGLRDDPEDRQGTGDE